MNQKLKICLLVIAAIFISALLVWKFVNKETEDFTNQKPTQTFSFQQIIDKTLTDTASLNKLKDVLIAVNGQVKKIIKDEKSVTIELGDTTSMSSITCQFDNRHLNELTSLNEGSQISVKGNITGFSIDTELGLGNTIEMKSCTLNK
jgi:Cu/Ag efflux protein CusF